MTDTMGIINFTGVMPTNGGKTGIATRFSNKKQKTFDYEACLKRTKGDTVKCNLERKKYK